LSDQSLNGVQGIQELQVPVSKRRFSNLSSTYTRYTSFRLSMAHDSSVLEEFRGYKTPPKPSGVAFTDQHTICCGRSHGSPIAPEEETHFFSPLTHLFPIYTRRPCQLDVMFLEIQKRNWRSAVTGSFPVTWWPVFQNLVSDRLLITRFPGKHAALAFFLSQT
jgi:hypothetical protein